MTCDQMDRLTRLHERAERHSDEYKRLSAKRSARTKALWHLQKSERLYFEISGRIRDFASAPADPEGNLPDAA